MQLPHSAALSRVERNETACYSVYEHSLIPHSTWEVFVPAHRESRGLGPGAFQR